MAIMVESGGTSQASTPLMMLVSSLIAVGVSALSVSVVILLQPGCFLMIHVWRIDCVPLSWCVVGSVSIWPSCRSCSRYACVPELFVARSFVSLRQWSVHHVCSLLFIAIETSDVPTPFADVWLSCVSDGMRSFLMCLCGPAPCLNDSATHFCKVFIVVFLCFSLVLVGLFVKMLDLLVQRGWSVCGSVG